MKKGRAPFLFLNRNDIWALALYVSRFHLVLPTREETFCRRPRFPITGNLARTWKPERFKGCLSEGPASLYSFLQPWFKKSTIQVQYQGNKLLCSMEYIKLCPSGVKVRVGKNQNITARSKKGKERREEQRDQENEIIKHHVTEQMCSRELMNIWNCFYSSSLRYKDRGRNQQ